MINKTFAAICLGALVLAGPARADNKPNVAPGTTLIKKSDTLYIAPGSGPSQIIQFTDTQRGTVGDYFRNYWLCPGCGYASTPYVQYQPGQFIGGGYYAPFPAQLASQLPPPPPGSQYVFANRNALLISQANGEILDVIPLGP